MRRVDRGGWDEEGYQAKLQVAVLTERLARPEAEVLAAYLYAYDFRPSRAEALCELARYCRMQQRYALGREFARLAMAVPIPADLLFVDLGVYQWRARDELAVSSYWCGDYARCAELCRELLASELLPDTEHARVAANLEFALAALK